LPKRRDPGGMGDTPGKVKSTASSAWAPSQAAQAGRIDERAITFSRDRNKPCAGRFAQTAELAFS